MGANQFCKIEKEGEILLVRRRFLKECGRWSLGVLLTTAGAQLARGQEFNSPGIQRTPLVGACISPGTNVEKTLAAVIDTVVPGPTLDPEGAPGGLESCAMNLLLDEYYPIKEVATIVASLMEQMGQEKYKKTFVECSLDERIIILVETQEALPMLRLAYRAIRSAFYGGAYNGVGLDYVGYPGPNLGYRHIEEASFRRPVCKEMTETGWMP